MAIKPRDVRTQVDSLCDMMMDLVHSVGVPAKRPIPKRDALFLDLLALNNVRLALEMEASDIGDRKIRESLFGAGAEVFFALRLESTRAQWRGFLNHPVIQSNPSWQFRLLIAFARIPESRTDAFFQMITLSLPGHLRELRDAFLLSALIGELPMSREDTLKIATLLLGDSWEQGSNWGGDRVRRAAKQALDAPGVTQSPKRSRRKRSLG